MLGQYGRTAGCVGLLCVALLAGCGGAGPGAAPPATGLSVQAQAGEALFFDRSLSASGLQLHQALRFYITRDINNNQANNPFWVPAGPPKGNPYQAVGTFYLAADGSPDVYQYNDLPVAFDANVNIGEIPYTPPTFAGGQQPTLTAAEIDDVIAFLCTLTDGFDPNNPGAYGVPAQCAPQAR